MSAAYIRSSKRRTLITDPSVLPHPFQHNHNRGPAREQAHIMGDLSREHASSWLLDRLYAVQLCVCVLPLVLSLSISQLNEFTLCSDPEAEDYTYFRRKHSPLVIHDDIANVSSRASLIRNFNDFAADINADALPQWSFVTPNMVNDAHDTTIDYASSWLEYWLVPLLNNPKFNSGEGADGTLVLLTFDENSVSGS